MRSVWVPDEAVSAIRAHARAAYPEECCGFLVTAEDPADPLAPREVLVAVAAANGSPGERGRRFVIDPLELRALERSLEGTSRLVAGFYHSHPDHPARPSQFDQEHAWPWYTYLVLSVTASETPALGAFELDPDTRAFQEVALAAGTSSPATVTETVRIPGRS
jgi:proteasome lid subunit RPN8/RPN11